MYTIRLHKCQLERVLGKHIIKVVKATIKFDLSLFWPYRLFKSWHKYSFKAIAFLDVDIDIITWQFPFSIVKHQLYLSSAIFCRNVNTIFF